MRPARCGVALAALVAAGLALASCGLVSIGGGDDAERVATVAVLAPGSGWQEADGEGVRAAVEVAIAQATRDIEGWTIDVVPVDENAEPAAVAEALRDLVEDDLIAVVGGLTTDAVRAAQPVLNAEDVVFVSPADDDPIHTRGADPGNPLRPYASYFRTAVADDSPASVLGRYAAVGLGADAVAVVDAGASAQARAFADAASEAGARVVYSRPMSKQVQAIVRDLRDKKAKAVFLAGPAKAAAELVAAIGREGLDIDVLGGPALLTEEFLAAAGPAARGALTAAPAELEPTAGVQSTKLTAELEQAGAAESGEYGAAAYDAGTALGLVLSRCLPAASSPSGAREGCSGEMNQIDFVGLTGHVAFDEYGDRVGGRVEVKVLRDSWESLGVEN